MPSIYLTTGQLVTIGPDGKPYTDEASARVSVLDRNTRATTLGISARYEVGPDAKK